MNTRIFSVLTAAGVFFLLITSIEFFQTNSFKPSNYDSGRIYDCATKLNACEETKDLLRSFSYRPSTFSSSFLNQQIHKLNNFCKENISLPERLSDINGAAAEINHGMVEKFVGNLSRIFITPSKVAFYHFKFVEDFGSYGISVVPVSKFFVKDYTNVNLLVCQKYFYSESSSSCTAPTSFFFTYIAHGSWLGFLLITLFCFLFDYFLFRFICRLPFELKVLSIALLFITIINFLISDFFTVLFSHGALLSFLIIFIMNKSASKKLKKD